MDEVEKMTREEMAKYLRYADTQPVDDILKKNPDLYVKLADGKRGRVLIDKKKLDAWLATRESPAKDSAQEALDKLKKFKLDPDRYPLKDYEHDLPKLNGWVAYVRTFIGGDPSWYEQRANIAGIKKYLGQIESACGLFGRVEAAVVRGILEALKNKIIALLGAKPLDGSVGKNIYPTLGTDRSLYAIQNNLSLGWLVEMNHGFFNLTDDQQLEIKNTSKKDILYSSELFGMRNDNRSRYRLPAEGVWTSIPPFAADDRPGSSSPGRFTSARELFNLRQDLQIRVVKKSSSKPPMCMIDELEKNIVIEIDRTAEINALIETIKSGE